MAKIPVPGWIKRRREGRLRIFSFIQPFDDRSRSAYIENSNILHKWSRLHPVLRAGIATLASWISVYLMFFIFTKIIDWRVQGSIYTEMSPADIHFFCIILATMCALEVLVGLYFDYSAQWTLQKEVLKELEKSNVRAE